MSSLPHMCSVCSGSPSRLSLCRNTCFGGKKFSSERPDVPGGLSVQMSVGFSVPSIIPSRYLEICQALTYCQALDANYAPIDGLRLDLKESLGDLWNQL